MEVTTMDTGVMTVLVIMAAAVLIAMAGVAVEALHPNIYVYHRKPNGKRGKYLGFAGERVRLLDGTLQPLPRRPPPRTGPASTTPPAAP
jgi:hypothetical protein